jgi:hypothetical protein
MRPDSALSRWPTRLVHSNAMQLSYLNYCRLLVFWSCHQATPGPKESSAPYLGQVGTCFRTPTSRPAHQSAWPRLLTLLPRFSAAGPRGSPSRPVRVTRPTSFSGVSASQGRSFCRCAHGLQRLSSRSSADQRFDPPPAPPPAPPLTRQRCTAHGNRFGRASFSQASFRRQWRRRWCACSATAREPV